MIGQSKKTHIKHLFKKSKVTVVILAIVLASIISPFPGITNGTESAENETKSANIEDLEGDEDLEVEEELEGNEENLIVETAVISEDGQQYIYGEFKQNGNWYEFFMELSQSGTSIQGKIYDEFGHATFSGSFVNNVFQFSKSYYSGDSAGITFNYDGDYNPSTGRVNGNWEEDTWWFPTSGIFWLQLDFYKDTKGKFEQNNNWEDFDIRIYQYSFLGTISDIYGKSTFSGSIAGSTYSFTKSYWSGTSTGFIFDYVGTYNPSNGRIEGIWEEKGNTGNNGEFWIQLYYPPEADANGPYSNYEGSLIIFDASGSTDPDGNVLQYRWDFNNDGNWDTSFSTSPKVYHTYYDDYYGIVRVQIYDGRFMISDTASVLVYNRAPTVYAGSDKIINENNIVIFSGYFTDPGLLDTHTLQWNFGDGTTASGTLSPTHRYLDNGIYTVTLTVTDDDGGVGIDTLTITVNNVAPTVDAGLDEIINENGVVSFSGSFMDPGTQDTHTVEWDFGDGTSSSGTLSPTHRYLDDGIYTVTLTVTDDDGGVGIDTLTITVNNVAPIVDAGLNEIINENDVVSFSGSFMDPGTQDTHTVEWDFGDGTSASGTLSPTHQYLDDGVYTVTLTVIDDDGGVGIDTLIITVNNVAPIVDAGPDQKSDEGSIVSFSGSFMDPGTQDTHIIVWDFGDGSPLETGNLFPTHQYLDDGVYKVTLTVTDDDGGVGIDTLTITVNNVAPIVDAGPDQESDEGSIVSFSGSFMDPGTQDTHIIVWDFGDGSPLETGNLFPTHQYLDDGVYMVTLTVTDDDGGVGIDTLILMIHNVAPTVVITRVNQSQEFVLEDLTFIMLDPITFSGNAYDPGCDMLTFFWDWGDGTDMTITTYPNVPPCNPVEIHETVEHAYIEPGEYLVTLTVEDDDGGIGTDEVIIRIWGPQELKESVISTLEASKTGNRCIDRKINIIIKQIEHSLNDKLWKDATHLNSKYGTLVFVKELVAVLIMEKCLIQSNLKPEIIKLVKADEIITKLALEDAEITEVKCSKFQKKVDFYLTKANEQMEKATEKIESDHYSRAIIYLMISWKYAQFAMKWANKECPPCHCYCYKHYCCYKKN